MFEYENKDGCIIVTMNRPPVNAIDRNWLNEFHGLLDRLETVDDAGVIHLRSSGRAFCAGMDLAYVEHLLSDSGGAEAMAHDVALFQRAFSRLELLPQVVISEIGGAALGGGLELALACDIRIAALDAKLGLPETTLGMIPAAGGTQRLTRLCGPGVASRLILTAEVVNGRKAVELGVVHWAIAEQELESKTAEVIAIVLGLGRRAVATAKRLIAAKADPDRDGFQEEREAAKELFGSSDSRDRIGQFLSRRGRR